jgi:hypothetical protein
MSNASGGNGTYIKQSSRQLDSNGCWVDCFGTKLGPTIKTWQTNTNWKLYYGGSQTGPWNLLDTIDVSDPANIYDFRWPDITPPAQRNFSVAWRCNSYVSFDITFTGGGIGGPPVVVTGRLIHSPQLPELPPPGYPYFRYSVDAHYDCAGTRRVEQPINVAPGKNFEGTAISAGFSAVGVIEPNPFAGGP